MTDKVGELLTRLDAATSAAEVRALTAELKRALADRGSRPRLRLRRTKTSPDVLADPESGAQGTGPDEVDQDPDRDTKEDRAGAPFGAPDGSSPATRCVQPGDRRAAGRGSGRPQAAERSPALVALAVTLIPSIRRDPIRARSNGNLYSDHQYRSEA